MPGLNIHFAIGNRYFCKNNIKDKNQFYEGLAAPDLSNNSKASHYCGFQDKDDLTNYLKNKVLLNKFLESNNIETDYKIGEFLHLITDFLFFNKFIDKDYLKKVTYDQFAKDLYYSYDMFDKNIGKNYQIDYGDLKETVITNIENSKKEKNYVVGEYTNIISEDKISEFIEYVASIDLKKYAAKIKSAGQNIMPD